MRRLVQIITARRTAWAVALVGFLLAGVVIGLLGAAERSASPTDTLPAGFDSTLGALLQQQLPDDDASTAIVLFTTDNGPIAQQLDALTQLVKTSAPAGTAADSIRLIPSEDGTAAIAVLSITSSSSTDDAAAITTLRAALENGAPDGVTPQVTGPAAIQADLSAVFDGADFTLLATTALVVAILLLITYRSPILWIIPLLVVGAADRLASVLATRVLKGFGIPWDESTIGILSVLVFGAGTNYALLLISRYRDELKVHEDRHEAMGLALKRAGEAIFSSAGTVFVGLLMLLLSAFPSTRGLGLACAVGVLIAAIFVLVVLPAFLSLFGRWVFWPKVPRQGQSVLADSRSLWRKIGDRVARSPKAFIGGTLVFLAACAFGISQISLGLSTQDQFLQEPEAISAASRLADSFPAGTSDPTVVVTATEDKSVIDGLRAAVKAVPGVQSIQPGAAGNGVTSFSVILQAGADTPEARTAVQNIREAVAATPDTHVTGSQAQSIDEAAASADDRLLIIPLILALVLIVLGVLLRSVLAPILLVLSVVATYAASLGVSWWIFTGIFGFSGLDSSVPLLAFLFLVALGIDYNIFLITRTLEEARTMGTRRGMLRALGATGGVITSAGILLAAVFAVLGVLPLVVLAQIGVIICIGVLLDTLLVRTVLVPAIVRVLGEKFWWPRHVGPSGDGAGESLTIERAGNERVEIP
ncbi:MAG: MMPL family transporter [Nakamurella sp.]